MFDRVWLMCFRCKCEFFVEALRLQAQPARACPNCGTPFDHTGMGLLTEGLRTLADASRTVTFRLEGDQKLLDAARTVQFLLTADKEPRL